MPYIDGESLRGRIRRSGPLPIGEAVQILREVADGLAHAHAQGVVHRDIKPDNVLLSGSHAFLADFGIARALEAAEPAERTMTATVAVVGTPAYMSPEQIRGQRQLDHRTDIYAFGVMAYKMLAGVPPFEATTAAAVMSAHLTEAPEPLSHRRRDVPPALAALVMKCLEKRADDRWQQTGDLLAALTVLRAGPGSGPAAGSRRRLGVAIGSIVAVAGIALAAWWALTNQSAVPALSVGEMKHVTRDPVSNWTRRFLPTVAPSPTWPGRRANVDFTFVRSMAVARSP